MTLLERIKKLCKSRGISVSTLEMNLEFPSNTIYQWKARTPGTDKLEKVADYFNVSVDYLLGRDEASNEEKEFEAFANDPDLLVWYRNLPEHDADELRRLRALWAIVKDEREKQ
ncbi:helix-turn-helix domain-containing protein [Listeria booriae]|uniref:Helix-turn-helix transcriptional regulator n=1 Tax=Listeria booriae TaxID=1552123 RepID=A0A7X0TKV8_9LIST|nr:helix-turn-helix transcriptional regulator [Listeria booriae]MBC1331061.1 helix-turn-helix transcriptional regulator [Listeria booriae]